MTIKKVDVEFDKTTGHWEVVAINQDDSLHQFWFATESDAVICPIY